MYLLNLLLYISYLIRIELQNGVLISKIDIQLKRSKICI